MKRVCLIALFASACVVVLPKNARSQPSRLDIEIYCLGYIDSLQRITGKRVSSDEIKKCYCEAKYELDPRLSIAQSKRAIAKNCRKTRE